MRTLITRFPSRWERMVIDSRVDRLTVPAGLHSFRKPNESMNIPTEPIGSIPRPTKLIETVDAENFSDPKLDVLYEAAVKDTIQRFEETGSPIITDGEQRKYQNFWTYSGQGLPNPAPDGFKIPFTAGHARRMPRLTAGPFRYKRYAYSYLDV